jgi:hypothetical protein
LAAVKLPSSAQNVSGFDFGFTKRRQEKEEREERKSFFSLSLSPLFFTSASSSSLR